MDAAIPTTGSHSLRSAHAPHSGADSTDSRAPARPVESVREPGAVPKDTVGISAEGLAALAEEKESEPGAADEVQLDDEQREQVRGLQTRDREVRAHENAHKAAAGSLAQGGPSYKLQRGPDGVSYAVGGEVQISLSEGATPQETVELAERARRAALAPSKPSGQDRAVAAQAAQMATAARAAVSAERQEQTESREPERAADGEVEDASGLEHERTQAYSRASRPMPVPDILGAIFG